MQELTIRKDREVQLSADRIAYLVFGYLNKTISATESAELQHWVARSKANQLLFAELILPYNIRSVLNNSAS